MLREHRSEHGGEDFIEFWPTGVHVKGEFHCAECGYGVTIHRDLPVCPMCGGESWEQTSWHPFTGANADATAPGPGTRFPG
jgi:rubrerythrin